MTTICKHCGHEMNFETINATHSLFGKSINVKNVPTYTCPQCQHSFYPQSDKIYELLVNAFYQGASEIVFK
jgi:type II secretory ATPase GspE/PulE/Tfp pilus assembly ATPase PilB-like protein